MSWSPLYSKITNCDLLEEFFAHCVGNLPWPVAADELELFSLKVKGVERSVLAAIITEEDDKVRPIDSSQFLLKE